MQPEAAYQKEPATPYVYATPQDDRRVTLQVQDEMTPAAVNPVPRDRLATAHCVESVSILRRVVGGCSCL